MICTGPSALTIGHTVPFGYVSRARIVNAASANVVGV